MSDKVVEPEVEHAHDASTKPVSKFTRWYRSPLFNVIVCKGLCCLTAHDSPEVIRSVLKCTFHGHLHAQDMLLMLQRQ